MVMAAQLCTSCYSSAGSDDDLIAEAGTLPVRVITRATSSADLTYPIEVVALDATGAEKAHQTLSTASDNLSLALTRGVYRIVAYSGSLTMPASGYSNTPLMLGSADVVVDSQPVTVSLLLSYQVSGLSVSLANVSSDATAVSLSVSSQYSQLSVDGTFGMPCTVTIPLTHTAGLWSSGDFYVMPGSGQQTSFSISVVTPEGQQTYGYTYGAALKAATPYTLAGTYEEGAAQITGILSSGTWSTPVDISFSFGEGATDTPVINPDDTATDLAGHVVAFADTTDTEITYMLISLADYTKVHSVTGDATEAVLLARAYAEGGLTGWRIPTDEEAKRLKAKYTGSVLAELNEQITAAGGSEILVYDAKGDNYRYLCADAAKTFQFKAGSSVTNAGATVTYGLRLVRTVVKGR